jgi:SAM-dependent methyltransferase
MRILPSVLLRITLRALCALPLRWFEALLSRAIQERSLRLSPAEALRFLFRLEARLYEFEGGQSVRYGGGLHTKHRHTRYHDFFVRRISSDERVLDVGCGIGALAYDIAVEAGAHVVGVDLEERSIEAARARFAHPRVEYHHGDALADIPRGAHDVIVLSNVLEHLPERAQFLRRLVAATGARRFLIRVPLFERDWRVPLRRELGVEWRLDPTHETEYTLESFAAEVAEASLVIQHQEVRWGEIWAEVGAEEGAPGATPPVTP